MTESRFVLEMNIAHYEAALKLDLTDKRRAAIERLLSQAKKDLAQALRAHAVVRTWVKMDAA